jgi:hypothetical protein
MKALRVERLLRIIAIVPLSEYDGIDTIEEAVTMERDRGDDLDRALEWFEQYAEKAEFNVLNVGPTIELPIGELTTWRVEIVDV